jgi:Mg2+/Co2+ transporter CorB
MSTEVWVTGGAIFVLIVMSAFFSGAETALTASSRARLHALEAGGNRRATTVIRLTETRDRLISALLFGNNLANILSSALATSLFLSLFGQAGVVYATIAMTVALFIFAEVLPKSWAIFRPERFALAVAPLVKVLMAVLGPLMGAVNWFVRRVLGLFGVNLASGASMFSAHDELRGAVEVLHMQGSVVKADRDRLGAILDLHELEVSDVMIHRTAMRSLNAGDPPEVLARSILESPHTRMPVWRDEVENIIGVVHAKDFLRALMDAGNDPAKVDIAKVASKPWFVPDSTSLQDQLSAFLRRKSHFAIVVDEYGEVEGLVTLEDILEEIVGEISDEHDIEVQGVQPEADGSVVVDGSVPIRDLNRALDWSLPDDEATTIAGLVIHETQTIPEEKQAFTFHGMRFTVLKRDRNRITRLRIRPLDSSGKPLQPGAESLSGS